MLVKDRMKYYEEKLEILKGLDPESTLDEDIFVPRSANCVLPDIEDTCKILGEIPYRITFYFAPQISFSEGMSTSITYKFRNDRELNLNSLDDVSYYFDDEKYNKIKSFYNTDEYWVDNVLLNSLSEAEDEDFYQSIRKQKISANFILSLITLRNRVFMRDNDIQLSVSYDYDDIKIDKLIELAESDTILETFCDSDT